MPNPENPTRPQPRNPLRKTSTRSPYFPPARSGPTKSPYFSGLPRHGSSKGGKAGSWVVDRKTPPRVQGQAKELLSITVNDRDDGWMTEQDTHHDKVSSKANRKIRRARDRRRKRKLKKKERQRQEKLDGLLENVTSRSDMTTALKEESAGPQNGRGTGIIGAGSDGEIGGDKLQRPKPKRRRADIGPVASIRNQVLDPTSNETKPAQSFTSKKLKNNEIPTPSAPTEESKPPHEPPHRSNKRKRTSIVAVAVTPPTLTLGNTLEKPTTQPVKQEVGHKRTIAVRQKRVRTAAENPAPKENPLQDRIFRWFQTAGSGANACQHNNTLVDKNPQKATVNSSAVAKSKDKDLREPSISVKPTELNESTPSTTIPRNKVSLTAPINTNQILDTSPRNWTTKLCTSEIEQEVDLLAHAPGESSQKSATTKIKRAGKVSSYFASSAIRQRDTTKVNARKKKCGKRRVPAGTSVIPWPALTAETFGLIQEELKNNAFHLIVATVFLNKTRGGTSPFLERITRNFINPHSLATAVPLLRQFLVDYPTPLALAEGDLQTITDFLRPLGLQHTRADRLIKMGKVWVENPPEPGKGTTKYNYPPRNTKPFNMPLTPDKDNEQPKFGVDQNCLWEIAHLPGVGAYALDSWRIFCLDEFRSGMLEVGVKEGDGNEKVKNCGNNEWRCVVPTDKELRAYLRWRWAKEGVRWREAGDLEVEVKGDIDGETMSKEFQEAG